MNKKTERIRVLIVEDEVLTAMLYTSKLQSAGYNVVGSYTTGEQAIAGTRTGSPDVIIMDINLAGEMDGIEAAARIHELYRVPIVFVTGYLDRATAARIKDSLAYGYLGKPVAFPKLLRIIENAAEN